MIPLLRNALVQIKVAIASGEIMTRYSISLIVV